MYIWFTHTHTHICVFALVKCMHTHANEDRRPSPARGYGLCRGVLHAYACACIHVKYMHVQSNQRLQRPMCVVQSNQRLQRPMCVVQSNQRLQRPMRVHYTCLHAHTYAYKYTPEANSRHNNRLQSSQRVQRRMCINDTRVYPMDTYIEDSHTYIHT